MQAIPIRRKGAPDFDLVIILEDENLARLKEYDPGELDLFMLGTPWNELRLRRVIFGYATPEEAKRIPILIRDGRAGEVMRLLSRGWKFRPDMGDHDGPYLDMKRKPS